MSAPLYDSSHTHLVDILTKLTKYKSYSVEAAVLLIQLPCCDHVFRKENSRIPKATFGKLGDSFLDRGAPLKHYKNNLGYFQELQHPTHFRTSLRSSNIEKRLHLRKQNPAADEKLPMSSLLQMKKAEKEIDTTHAPLSM